ncbi:hypothetical protein [Chamaesiphon sp.]|uniref:hypothetical protein n=1 Tax=Chamaesiphon sp. TaxID=2814140 RepID=UPI0035932C9D
MNSKILIGSTVYGSAGLGCKVLSIDGDTLTIETSRGEGIIPISRVVNVDPLPLLDRLLLLDSLVKQDAIDELTAITLDFSVNYIYEASLDLEIFFGTFIRRSLSELSPVEFEAIGKDGSEGKYGLWTSPDSPPPNNLTDDGIFTIGDCVTHTDLYHCYGADVGTIELVDSFGDYHVRWKSDGHIGRYSADNLELCKIVSRSSPDR